MTRVRSHFSSLVKTFCKVVADVLVYSEPRKVCSLFRWSISKSRILLPGARSVSYVDSKGKYVARPILSVALPATPPHHTKDDTSLRALHVPNPFKVMLRQDSGIVEKKPTCERTSTFLLGDEREQGSALPSNASVSVCPVSTDEGSSFRGIAWNSAGYCVTCFDFTFKHVY